MLPLNIVFPLDKEEAPQCCIQFILEESNILQLLFDFTLNCSHFFPDHQELFFFLHFNTIGLTVRDAI